jgi:acyl carrier protein
MSDAVSVKVMEAVAKVKRIPLESITPASRLEDLGMDSLDGLNLFFELEEAFDISIPDEEARALRSVADIINGIGRLLEAREAKAGQRAETLR